MPRGVYERKPKGTKTVTSTETATPGTELEPEADEQTNAEPGGGGQSEPKICGLCWPDGWGQHDTAMCEHGEWSRA